MTNKNKQYRIEIGLLLYTQPRSPYFYGKLRINGKYREAFFRSEIYSECFFLCVLINSMKKTRNIPENSPTAVVIETINLRFGSTASMGE